MSVNRATSAPWVASAAVPKLRHTRELAKALAAEELQLSVTWPSTGSYGWLSATAAGGALGVTYTASFEECRTPVEPTSSMRYHTRALSGGAESVQVRLPRPN